MFIWIDLGPKFPTERGYRVMALLRQERLPFRRPADDMFFCNAFSLPHPDRRWSILVRRRDRPRALSLLRREGLL